MGQTTAQLAALMSIRPPYASAILAGTKRVEFRKRPLNPAVTHIFVYSTAPVAKVIGHCEMTGQDEAPPQTLWSRYHKVGGIQKAELMDYYDGHALGVAIKLGEFVAYPSPLSLQESFGIARAPQSFQYLDADVVDLTSRDVHNASTGVSAVSDRLLELQAGFSEVTCGIVNRLLNR